MRFTTIMRPTEPKASTTVYVSLDYRSQLRPCYINNEFLASSSLGSFEAIGVVISAEELTDSDIVLALPPIPFFKTTPNTVRYAHRIVRGGKERTVPTSPVQPVTWLYVEKSALPDSFIYEKQPIYIGLFAIVNGAKQIKAAVTAVEEDAKHEALAVLDDFLDGAVLEEEGWKADLLAGLAGLCREVGRRLGGARDLHRAFRRFGRQDQ